jgi:peptidoglycan/xylan/chitin deacetylase (PgdA/CDA1 family)
VRSSASFLRIIGIAIAVVVAVAVIGLMMQPSSGQQPVAAPPAVAKIRQTAPAPAKVPAVAEPPAVVSTPELAKQVKANELGMVPVMMYHRILQKPIASIDRTPDQLRRELEKLASQGYVPITAKQFATGDVRVPAGKFPVVLTFDDGSESHFRLDASGNPAHYTAVSVLMEVAQKYPDFRPVATLWINRDPFGLRKPEDQATAVHWLVSHGFEVANHTWSHADLARLPKKRVKEQIVRLERLLDKLGAGPAATLALPYGAMPHPRKLARTGEWDGTSYNFAGVFLAGAQPSLSPYAKKFDPLAIQRIQSNGKKGECRKWCSQYWLEWLNKHPEDRYTSDGDPAHISIPRDLRGNITPKWRGRLVVY